MSTKVIFRRAEVFVLAEVCLLRCPHAVLPRSQVLSEKRKGWRTWKADEYIFSFKHRTEVGLHADFSEDFRSSKNNFRGHDISQGLDREPPSLSPHFLLIRCVRKRLNYVQPNYAVVKRLKESPGKTFRMSLVERCPNNPLSTSAPTCSTPKIVVDDVLEVENEEPQELQNTSSADSSLTP